MNATTMTEDAMPRDRRASGAKAQQFGAQFERIFQAMCFRVGVAATRMPDGCRSAGPNRLVRVKTPWDWIVTHCAKTGLIDTKTTDGNTFPHSKIEPHQVRAMLEHENWGAVAGYVVWMRATNKVIFLPASALVDAMKHRGSINDGHPRATLLGNIASFDVRKAIGDVQRG